MTEVDGEKYMLVNLDKVKFWDLCWFLICEQRGVKKFISSHDDSVLSGTFFYRFVIFSSIVIRKFLTLISKILERLGTLVEYTINLSKHHGSFYKLVINTLRGKKVEIDPMKADYSSATGLPDSRLDLDDKISREDPRYNSHLAIMASIVAYENCARIKMIVKDHWKMDFLGFYNILNVDVSNQSVKMAATQAFIFSDTTGDHELICVSFRGTSIFSAGDLCTDFDLSWFHLCGVGKVHAGFWKALGLETTKDGRPSWREGVRPTDTPFAFYRIRQFLREKLRKNKDARFIVTGHSLGGAFAVLFTTILGIHNDVELLEKLEGVYTFGQPRVGDDDFCKFMESVLGARRYFRFVYANDLIPRVPFDDSTFQYKHFGHCYYFNSLYKGEVMKEVPNMNYFSLSDAPFVFLNGFFEFIRGFILHHLYGSDYKEGIVLLGIRALGMVTVPGLSAHGAQDYLNLTRLGDPSTFSGLHDHRQ